MTFFSFLIVGTLLVILQTTLLMPTPIWPFAPDFYFIFVVYLARKLPIVPALVLVYLIGLMLDVLTGTVLGMASLMCFAGFGLVRLFSERLVLRDLFCSIPLVSLTFFLVSGLVYVIFDFLNQGQLVSWDWWEMGIRTSMVAIFSWPLFRFFDVVHEYSLTASLPWNRQSPRDNARRRRQT